MATYPYRPLNLPRETRILHLLPGADEDDLICHMSHMDIESGGPYEALSYCWSSSIANPLDLDNRIVVASEPDSEKEPKAIKVRDMLGDPDYEYLYIKFGGSLPDGKIICDDVEITVGGELFRALKRMRDEEEPLRIWVDALCINQSDILEKNEHVKRMGEIYKRASNVRVWLGDEIGIEPSVFSFLEEISTVFRELSPKLEEAGSILEAQKYILSHPKTYALEWNAMAQFLDRAWFERIWVVQEIANAKDATIYIGRFRIPWRVVEGTLNTMLFYKMSDLTSNPLATKRATMMGKMRKDIVEGSYITEEDFLETLENLRDFKSTMPSDKIYGMLGLVDQSLAVEVDYAKSPEQVFTELAVRYLKTGSLELLCHCVWPSQPSSLTLPSWVPDWTRPGWAPPLRARGLKCNVAGDTKPQMEIDASKGVLRLKGRVLDTVRVVNDKTKIPLTDFKPDDFTAWRKVEDPGERLKAKFRAEQTSMREAAEQMFRLAWPSPGAFSWEKLEDISRAFMCNRTRDNEPPAEDYSWQMVLWMEWIFFQTTTEEERTKKSPYIRTVMPAGSQGMMSMVAGQQLAEEKLMALGGAHLKWCYNRRFFISQAERYGWAMDGAARGDQVVLFYGCEYPFLIREAGEGRHRIIGDCYIHGLMDGEGLREGFEEREFMLV